MTCYENIIYYPWIFFSIKLFYTINVIFCCGSLNSTIALSIKFVVTLNMLYVELKYNFSYRALVNCTTYAF